MNLHRITELCLGHSRYEVADHILNQALAEAELGINWKTIIEHPYYPMPGQERFDVEKSLDRWAKANGFEPVHHALDRYTIWNKNCERLTVKHPEPQRAELERIKERNKITIKYAHGSGELRQETCDIRWLLRYIDNLELIRPATPKEQTR